MIKQAFQLVGVTEADYRKWCKENKKSYYKPEVKAEFFSKIQSGRLVKDADGKLIKKRLTKKGQQ